MVALKSLRCSKLPINYVRWSQHDLRSSRCQGGNHKMCRGVFYGGFRIPGTFACKCDCHKGKKLWVL